MKRAYRRILIALAALFILCLTAALAALFLFEDRLIGYLSVNQPAEEEYLVVEGWVDDLVLDQAVTLYQKGNYSGVVVTGSYIEPDLLMSTNGLLEFNLAGEGIILEPGDQVRVCLRGTPMKHVFPFFVVVLNGREYHQGFATGDWEVYTLPVDSAIKLNDVGIFFGNDDFYGKEDRNLEIRNITIGDRIIPARSEYTLRYDKKDQAKQHPYPTNFRSVAAICAHKLGQRGIPPEQIVVLPSTGNIRFRTLTSALEVNRWLCSAGLPEATSINVVSERIHARRTLILYRMALEGSTTNVGIISIAPGGERYLGFTISKKNIVRELAGSFYYRYIFSKRKFEKKQGKHAQEVPTF